MKKKKREPTEDSVTDYLLYKVVIQNDQGKKKVMKYRNNNTLFNYYRVGVWVRHHAGLETLEKYDKSRDSIIPCNACSKICSIQADYCERCRCPLLK